MDCECDGWNSSHFGLCDKPVNIRQESEKEPRSLMILQICFSSSDESTLYDIKVNSIILKSSLIDE